jgi:hypothetical protein
LAGLPERPLEVNRHADGERFCRLACDRLPAMRPLTRGKTSATPATSVRLVRLVSQIVDLVEIHSERPTAHLLLQMRCALLDNRLDDLFREGYQALGSSSRAVASSTAGLTPQVRNTSFRPAQIVTRFNDMSTAGARGCSRPQAHLLLFEPLADAAEVGPHHFSVQPFVGGQQRRPAVRRRAPAR